MNDRAIHYVNNGRHQQSQGVGVQQSSPPTTTTGSPVIEHPTPISPALPSATPTSRIPNAAYMALFGKEYECLCHKKLIAAWKLSVEKKRLELCAGLKMSLSPGKSPPTGTHQQGAPVPPFPEAPISHPGISAHLFLSLPPPDWATLSRCPGHHTI